MGWEGPVQASSCSLNDCAISAALRSLSGLTLAAFTLESAEYFRKAALVKKSPGGASFGTGLRARM